VNIQRGRLEKEKQRFGLGVKLAEERASRAVKSVAKASDLSGLGMAKLFR